MSKTRRLSKSKLARPYKRFLISSRACTDPVIGSDGTIYVGAGPYLIAIESDGDLIFEKNDEVLANFVSYNFSNLTIGLNDTLYATIDSYNRRFLLALDFNGNIKWRYQFGNRGSEAPIIGKDGLIYVVGGVFSLNTINYGYLFAFQEDGRVAWQSEKLGTTFASNALIADNGKLYLPLDRGVGLLMFNTSSLGLADSPWPAYRQNNQNTGRAP